ncbi:MAG TPA: hypothetical protein VKD69_02585 [Vicinamibacterales bacterium]|nr:hypothetical protein [Vicinamibacterales bacterium]
MTMAGSGSRPRRGATVVVAWSVAALAIALVPLRAQVTKADNNITPVYEGWLPNADGSFELVFGYFNRDWDEALSIPLGPNNAMDPGGPDLGQPTNFFPRRNRFVFTVHVPRDFGTREIVWTLTSRGRTEKAYGTLKNDYVLDDTVIMSNIGAGGALSTTPDMVGNTAPVLTFDGPPTRHAKVGEAVPLSAVATDDGKPNKRNMPAILGGNYMLPQTANGLRLSFFVYRGRGTAVTFDPPQTKVWEDTRDGGGSPWSAGWVVPPVPEGSRWQATATFAEAGTYVIRALAHDGGLFSSRDITIVVK